LQKRKERELQLQKEHEEEIRIAHLYADVQVAQFSSGAAQEAQHHSGNFAAASELYKLRQQIPIKWSEVPTEKYKREMPVKLLGESGPPRMSTITSRRPSSVADQNVYDQKMKLVCD
jgi:hypothetical protein